jgi:hypothetical protein
VNHSKQGVAVVGPAYQDPFVAAKAAAFSKPTTVGLPPTPSRLSANGTTGISLHHATPRGSKSTATMNPRLTNQATLCSPSPLTLY